ncbi:MAG: hypothetical protein GF398_07135 [Chitinivibrionales bacterium]|nr:hypothetical protein [Chitinivibrionales bacterium]
MSIICLVAILHLCDIFAVHHRFWVGVAWIIHPVVWVNSTCTIDYLWAVAFLLVGVILLLHNKIWWGALVLGLSIGIRLSSFMAVGGLLVLAAIKLPQPKVKIIACGVLAGAVGAACYLPVYLYSHQSFHFLGYTFGNPAQWTPYLRLGRFVYKNIYFWGLAGTSMLGVIAAVLLINWKKIPLHRYLPLLGVTGMLAVGYELLLFRYPFENEYLLSMLPFVLLSLGVLLARFKRLLIAFVIVLAAYNFVSINIAKPDEAFNATSASYGLWLEKGYLLSDAELRLKLGPARNILDWQEYMDWKGERRSWRENMELYNQPAENYD